MDIEWMIQNISDIVVYNNSNETFTWLDIACIGDAVFITFTITVQIPPPSHKRRNHLYHRL